MSESISIDDRQIGAGHSPFLIAELSGNHNGSIDRAVALMKAAAGAGADAIKLQTYTPDTLTIDCDKPDFLISEGPWAGRTLYDLYQEAHTPWEWHEQLFRVGRDLGITVFSTPFDETAVDLLEKLDAPAYKIASFEAVDLHLIEKAASTGKPLIISTGMADLQEIRESVETAHVAGSGGVILLHCVSAYPARPEDYDLCTIPQMADAMGVPVGLSDHSLGTEVAVAATALGAVAIEKHFTLARADGGPDAAFSLEPAEFAEMARMARSAWSALGTANYDQKDSEKANLIFRRSLYVVREVAEGDKFSRENVRCIRPGFGIKPKHLKEVLGKRANRRIPVGTALKWNMVQA
jgi:pseudaminic acid synthase